MGFFRAGFTRAFFRELGKPPVERQVLIRWENKGRRSGAIDWNVRRGGVKGAGGGYQGDNLVGKQVGERGG